MRIDLSRVGQVKGSRRKSGLVLTGAILVALAVSLLVALWPRADEASTSGAGGVVEQPALGTSAVQFEIGEVELAGDALAFESPDSMALYTTGTSSQAVSREVMDGTATLLGLGDDRRYGPDFVSDERLYIEFPRPGDAGCFLLRDRLAIGELDELFVKGAEFKLPSPEEARRVADETLQSLGLLEGLDCLSVAVCDSLTISGGGKPDRSCDLTIGVWYEANVGGFPLVGPGAKVYVLVGPELKIIEVRHYAQEAVESGKGVPIRPLSAAIEDMKQNEGVKPEGLRYDNCSRLVVERAQLAY